MGLVFFWTSRNMFLLCSNARSLHIKASNCWVTLFTFAKSFEYMTAFCAFFTVCVRTPYNDWGGGEAGGGGGRLDEQKIQLSTEHSIDALLLRTFTGRYLNVRQIELKTRGNT